MFDIFSWQHIIILLVVALVVVGPKDLPRMMNMAGKWAGKARAMANEFRKSFDDMARQAELDELRKEIDELKKHNPLADVESAINSGMDGSSPSSQIRAEAAAMPDAVPEPRSGELQVTDAAPHHDGSPTP